MSVFHDHGYMAASGKNGQGMRPHVVGHQGSSPPPVRRFAVMPTPSASSLSVGLPTGPNSHLHLAVPIREPTPEPVKEPTPPPAPEPEPDDDDELDGEIDIQVRNVVCNYTLPLHIDLRRLALRSNNVTFDRGRGVLLKQKRDPTCYVKIYSSGKVYIVGCRSEGDCRRAARSIARNVQRAMDKLHETVRIRNYRVCNVLATCKMPFGVRVEDLAAQYPQNSQYEPELSVGLVWRQEDPKATLRIHTTGSITVTGASSEHDVMRAIEIIYPIVKKFKCPLRMRGEVKSTRRKRPAAPGGGPPEKYQRQVESGVIGNRVYFSDEEDLYDEDILEDDDL